MFLGDTSYIPASWNLFFSWHLSGSQSSRVSHREEISKPIHPDGLIGGKRGKTLLLLTQTSPRNRKGCQHAMLLGDFNFKSFCINLSKWNCAETGTRKNPSWYEEVYIPFPASGGALPELHWAATSTDRVSSCCLFLCPPPFKVTWGKKEEEGGSLLQKDLPLFSIRCLGLWVWWA